MKMALLARDLWIDTGEMLRITALVVRCGSWCLWWDGGGEVQEGIVEMFCKDESGVCCVGIVAH